MMSIDIDRIQIGEPTQIRLFTDHRNWNQSTPQAPVFAAPSGLTISSQEISDDHTALLTVNPANANTLATIVDPMNNEAVTLKCWDTPQFIATGQYPQTNTLPVVDESQNPVSDGYWDSSDDASGFSGGGLI